MRAKALYYDDCISAASLLKLRAVKKYANSCYFRNPAGEFITFLKSPNQLVPGGIEFAESVYGQLETLEEVSLELISGEAKSLELPSECGISFEASARAEDKWRLAQDDFKNILDFLIAGRNWKKLLGLGGGLTPSGDDFLVGYIAAKKMGGMEIPFKLDLSRTTPLSAHFLKHALRGRFSDQITAFIKEGDLSILSFGGSSGAATAVGVIKGLAENECLRAVSCGGADKNNTEVVKAC
ncbi:DUF2877 domain-containing protein [bacterium]|nr:DUF2877 domain-containing protein [Candidatus Omnitrophota bacterium]MBU2528570.1 DUF2877 domain-containing protein [bacterium]MBU3930350.1 DUF2877 domain-containing protein [bacterium]MBU4123490.1 DUF2877 domain-containing protein [bacterium]